jgi:ribosomal protein S6
MAEVPAQGLRNIESTLHITDEVIRFLITKPDEQAAAKAEAFKAKRHGNKQITQQTLTRLNN